MPPTVCSIQATLAVLLYSSPMYVALELAMDIDKPVTTRAPFLWAWLEVRKKDSCLSHEGSGNARQRQCHSHDGSRNTQGKGSCLSHDGSGNTRQSQCLATKAVETQGKSSCLSHEGSENTRQRQLS